MIEAAIHQYKGDYDKSEKWLKRFTSFPFDYLSKIQSGEFFYYNGSKIEILGSNKSHTNDYEY